MKYDNKGEKVFLPVLINITDKKILIIGGGKVAVHKLSTLLKFTDDITILAPDIIEEIGNDSRLTLLIKHYEKEDLFNFHIVYACTNDKTVNATIKKDANSLGLLVNVADDPELCDFVSPAIYKDNYITVAVGSNAQDVKKAIQIKNRIKKILEDDKLI
jgi:siroheme synthase-like protein